MGRIRKNEVSDDYLSKHEYEDYKKKFPDSLKQGVPFSNQWKIHGELGKIKEENKFTTAFFKAAQIYANTPDSSSSSSRFRRSSINSEEFDNDLDLTASSSTPQNQITIDLVASNERKIILESQETEFKYTIKNLKDTIKDFEATINVLRNNEINLKVQYKELSRELTLLKNKNEESENRKK
ncbi:2537_t:CDS:2 [Dentiscutata erythropus]|uniref:2537_t:CDS:1 n=1 Tax=Dentiscutata erythropus TaxID=1348616 RepID=A0A9N9C2H8_9GLOM|nr:2537_t:CDS:2 [Dentiscutata erythropus]